MRILFYHKAVKTPKNAKVCKIFLYVLFLSMPLFLSGKTSYATESITVAVASSLYVQMQTQAQAYEKEHDVKIRLISGSTGRLYNQIIQGAPFDVFIAADTLRPKLLLQRGKAISTHEIGHGYLGITIAGKPVSNTKNLMNPTIQHIAIANPDVAPFGQVTKKLLKEQKLWNILKPKFIYAQNALQARMLVQKGLVDAGFVPTNKGHALMRLPYMAVLLSKHDTAKYFYDDLGVTIQFSP